MAFGFDDAIAAGLKIVNKFIPDPEMAAKAESELRSDLAGWDKAQMAVNAAEASSGSIFVGGWRPAIGWICAIALGFQYVAIPIVTWVGVMAGFTIPTPPVLDGVLTELMFGMLGMGGLRTFEKLKNVARK